MFKGSIKWINVLMTLVRLYRVIWWWFCLCVFDFCLRMFGVADDAISRLFRFSFYFNELLWWFEKRMLMSIIINNHSGLVDLCLSFPFFSLHTCWCSCVLWLSFVFIYFTLFLIIIFSKKKKKIRHSFKFLLSASLPTLEGMISFLFWFQTAPT